jgi:hypothetical protein
MQLPFTGWQPQPENGTQNPSNIQQSATPNVEVKKPSTHIRQGKTVAEKDAEMRAKLEGISGEGGEAGVELEDGKAVGLKRGVKENMFRIIWWLMIGMAWLGYGETSQYELARRIPGEKRRSIPERRTVTCTGERQNAVLKSMTSAIKGRVEH